MICGRPHYYRSFPSCKHVLNSVSSCYHSDSALVRFVLKHGIDDRVNSPLGRNVTCCSLLYTTLFVNNDSDIGLKQLN